MGFYLFAYFFPLSASDYPFLGIFSYISLYPFSCISLCLFFCISVCPSFVFLYVHYPAFMPVVPFGGILPRFLPSSHPPYSSPSVPSVFPLFLSSPAYLREPIYVHYRRMSSAALHPPYPSPSVPSAPSVLCPFSFLFTITPSCLAAKSALLARY